MPVFLLGREVKEMNEIIEKEEIKVENMIYEIRGKQVILDSDLAKLYGTDNSASFVNGVLAKFVC